MKTILDVEKEIVEKRIEAVEIDLIDGKYLKREICAVSGDWLIVFDGKYNYMLFSTAVNEVRREYRRNCMPSDNVDRGTKEIEYYSNFDNACDNLMRVVANASFKPTFLKDVFVRM